MGMFFNTFFRHADIVKMANLAQMVNVIAPIMTNEKGLFLQPIYFRSRNTRSSGATSSLDVWVSSPTYKIRSRPQDAEYLDVSATYDQSTRGRRQRAEPQQGHRTSRRAIENQGGRVGGPAAVWQMNHAGPEGHAHLWRRQKVRPKTSTATLTGGQSRFPRTR